VKNLLQIGQFLRDVDDILCSACICNGVFGGLPVWISYCGKMHKDIGIEFQDFQFNQAVVKNVSLLPTGGMLGL
jgi:hypothetical protein